MPKQISTPAVITTISSRQDGSLRFSTETPEYSADEKSAFFELQGKNITILITPSDETPEEEIKIDREVGEMTLSQEQRWRIKKKWKESASIQEKYPDADMYYRHVMRKIIDQISN